MKKNLILFSVWLFVSAIVISCGGNKQESQQPTETPAQQAAVYQCPMKCEGDKTYTEPGKCPKCGMDLKPVEQAAPVEEIHNGEPTEVEQDTV
jgi:hypothetical protein